MNKENSGCMGRCGSTRHIVEFYLNDIYTEITESIKAVIIRNLSRYAR